MSALEPVALERNKGFRQGGLSASFSDFKRIEFLNIQLITSGYLGCFVCWLVGLLWFLAV